MCNILKQGKQHVTVTVPVAYSRVTVLSVFKFLFNLSLYLHYFISVDLRESKRFLNKTNASKGTHHACLSLKLLTGVKSAISEVIFIICLIFVPHFFSLVFIGLLTNNFIFLYCLYIYVIIFNKQDVRQSTQQEVRKITCIIGEQNSLATVVLPLRSLILILPI